MVDRIPGVKEGQIRINFLVDRIWIITSLYYSSSHFSNLSFVNFILAWQPYWLRIKIICCYIQKNRDKISLSTKSSLCIY
ncbi:MAG: hypothetical protein ACI4LS_09620, partial [Treponema sp.]